MIVKKQHFQALSQLHNYIDHLVDILLAKVSHKEHGQVGELVVNLIKVIEVLGNILPT